MGFGNKIIGVTGVIGSGKSAFCHFLQEQFGFHWINTDSIVHELYAPGQPGYRKIQECFGSQFVGGKGVLRGRLRRFILSSQQKLWILNKLIHPLIVHEVNKKIVQINRLKKAEKKPICIEAVYFEPKDLGQFIDELIMVDVSDETIFKRLAKLKIPRKQLSTLLKFQRKNCLTVKRGLRIENDGTMRDFNSAMSSLMRRIMVE